MKPKQFVSIACLIAGFLANRVLAQNYAPAVNYATGKAPVALVTGDFHHDGNMDVIVANSGEASLSLFQGNGDGTFKPAVAIPVGSAPASVAAADFKGDGNLDVATALADSPAVQVLFGNGDGTFQAPVTIAVPVSNSGHFSVGQIAAADLKGDGHPDLLLATSSGLYVFANDGHGGFTTDTDIVGPHLNISSFAVADFNQDGRPDIAWIGSELSQCGAASATVFLSYGNGDGTFKDPVALPIANFTPGGIAAGDFNRDGRMDIVVSEVNATVCPPGTQKTGLVQVALQQGDGSFAVSSGLTGIANPGGIIAGDFDGDGNLDIAVLQPSFNSAGSSPPPDAVMIYRGDGGGAFSTPNQFALPAAPRTLVSGTFTNTVALDLATVDTTADQLSVLVNQGGNTLALASSSNPAKMHQRVTLTATVQPRLPGNSTPPGSVIFADGQTNLGTATLNASGVATLTTTFDAKGKHSLVAVYGGNEKFAGGSSSTLQQIVNGPPPDVFMQSGPNPSAFGQTVKFTVNVFLPPSGPVPTGTVNLTEAGNVIVSGVLDSTGQVRLQVNTLSVGSHTVVAEYLGDSTFGPANSLPLTQVVNGSSSTTTVNLSPNPSVFGQTVTITASVAAGNGFGTPSGSVSFTDGGTSIGSASLDGSGNATLQINSFGTGDHSIAASYAGDGNFQPSSSSPVTLTVNQSPTTTNISAAPNPSVFGQAVTLTAIVTAAGGGVGTPTGSVVFSEGATTLGSASLDNAGRASLAINSLLAGNHNITSSYSGDGNFAGSSAAASQTVNKSQISMSASSTPNPSVHGQAVTLSATVSASGGGAGTPSGAVTFSEGASTFGSASLDNNGRTSITIASLTAGAHNIDASYSGDLNFLASTASVSQTVNKSPTTTNVSAAPNPSVHGQSVTFTVTVAASEGGAGMPSGTVTFNDDASTLGSPSLDNTGRASLTVNSLAAGTHNITAGYGGDTNFLGSTAAVSQTVNKSPTTTSMTAAPNPSVFGQSVTLSITVSPTGGGTGTPSGNVTVSDAGTTIGTAALDNAGKAVLSISSLSVGKHDLRASYAGDNNFNPSSTSGSGGVTQVVSPSSTLTTLSSSSASSVFGQTITLAAVVTPSGGGAGVPSGTVVFSDGTTVIGSEALDNTGKATLTTSSLAVGSHSLTASYHGNPSFLASISTPLSQFVNKDSVMMSLFSTPNPSTYGERVTFTLQVSPDQPGGSPGTPLPTGTVTLTEGANVLGTATLDQSAKAAFVISNFTAGTHILGATYSGDANFSNSTLSGHHQEVDKASTQTTLTSSLNPATNASTILLSAHVSSSAQPLTGMVTFLDGTEPLASVPLDGSGGATLPLSHLSIGNHSLTAAYAGDTNFAKSQSAAVNEKIVDSHGAVVLTSSVNPQTVTKEVTFIASVTPALGGTASGGTVTFSDGPTALATVPLGNSTATFTTVTLAVGDHDITATYQAGTAPGPFDGISPVLAQSIKPASPIVIIGGDKKDFTIAIAEPSADVVAGQTFTTQVMLTPVHGLTGNILTICVGAPAGSTCAVTPDQSTLDGKNPINATVTVTTTGSSAVSAVSLGGTKATWVGELQLSALALLPVVVGICFIPIGETRKRRVFIVALLAGLLAGCGGTKFLTKPLPNNTPSGSYHLTVQSQSGSLVHSDQIVLAVK